MLDDQKRFSEFKNKIEEHIGKKVNSLNELTIEMFRNEDFQKIIYPKFRQLDQLFKKNHDPLGKILKFHLSIEYVINEYLEYHYKDSFQLNTILKLNFKSKLALIKKNEPIVLLIPGIIELNNVRNKLSHNIFHELTLSDISHIRKILRSFNEDINDSDIPIEIIDKFAGFACGFFLMYYGEPYEIMLEKRKKVAL